MQRLTLLNKNNSYEPANNVGKTIWLLEYFLHNISLNEIPSYIEWALDPLEYNFGAGNTSFLKKKNNNILIGHIFSDDPDGDPFFEISLDQFIKLLDEWKKLAEAKTPMITITEKIVTLKDE